MTLATRYLGLTLAHPIVASASPLTSTVDGMRRLIGEWPAEFREVIVLREINDLSYRDIATVIEAPIGTVMSRLARARGMLRDAWIAAEGRSGS